jgi:hypothetical protein
MMEQRQLICEGCRRLADVAAENERLRDDLDEAIGRRVLAENSNGHAVLLKMAEAKVERLRAALSPFAEIGGRFPTNDTDEREMYHSNRGRLTLGDFRNAWAALGDQQQERTETK